MSVTVDSPADEAVIVMTRMFDAPRPLVWACMTQPEHMARWWGGPGFTNPVCEIDLRPGGLWRHVMRAPNGTEYAFDFIYLEVVEPERLVWQNTDHGKRKDGKPTCVTTVTLEEHGARTRWRMLARFDSIAARDLAVKMGFSQMIDVSNDRLEAYLKSSKEQ
jgi:uncharacterized protein YndB with AHSA1/START domain